MQKHFICDECDADFKIHFEQEEDDFIKVVGFCPFCSNPIEEEEDEDDIDYE